MDIDDAPLEDVIAAIIIANTFAADDGDHAARTTVVACIAILMARGAWLPNGALAASWLQIFERILHGTRLKGKRLNDVVMTANGVYREVHAVLGLEMV